MTLPQFFQDLKAQIKADLMAGKLIEPMAHDRDVFRPSVWLSHLDNLIRNGHIGYGLSSNKSSWQTIRAQLPAKYWEKYKGDAELKAELGKWLEGK